MTNFLIQKVAYGNGVFIAAAEDRILRSTDGINWETVKISNNITENNHLNNVVFGDGKFVVGGECVTYATADNGLTWTEYLSVNSFEDIAYGNGEFILSSISSPSHLETAS